jgi:hypothetical protein
VIKYCVRFLAYVDLLGTTYSASTLATGYGSYIAQPLLRKAVEGHEDTLTEEEALKIIEQSMKVLYYRDARSINKVWSFPYSPFFVSHLNIVSNRHYYGGRYLHFGVAPLGNIVVVCGGYSRVWSADAVISSVYHNANTTFVLCFCSRWCEH